jgi:hypothetical protein
VTATLIEFPLPGIDDVPRALRTLADQIEAGEYGDAHNLAWAIDCGEGRLEVGMCGKAPEPGLLGHYMFARAQRKMELL